MDKLTEIKDTDTWTTGDKVVVDGQSAVIESDVTYPTGKVVFDYPKKTGLFYSTSKYGAVLLHIPSFTGNYFRITFTGTESGPSPYSVDVPPALVVATVTFPNIPETPTITGSSNVTFTGSSFSADLSVTSADITYMFSVAHTFTNYVVTPTVSNSYGTILNIPVKWNISTSFDGTTFETPALVDLTASDVLDSSNVIIPSYYSIKL